MNWRSVLFVISVSIAILGLFLPYPASLVIVFISSVSIFLVMGISSFVVAAIVIGLIVLSPIFARIAVSEFYSEFFFRNFGKYSKDMDYHISNVKMKIPKVESLSVDGVNLKVEIDKNASETILIGKMKVNSFGGHLEIHSKESGKIISGNLDSLEINGMNINVFGDGKVRDLEVNGIDSSVNLSNLTKLNLEVNGMGNSLKLRIHGNIRAEINGMSNEIKITFTRDSFGEAYFNVNGTENDVKIYIQKGSKIRVKSKPTFFNSVKIIELR